MISYAADSKLEFEIQIKTENSIAISANILYLCRLKSKVMDVLKHFVIPFTGLKICKHEFSFDIQDSFFAAFEHSLVDSGSLQAEVVYEKQHALNVVWCRLEGSVQLQCDRCLAPYPFAIDLHDKIYVKIGEEESDSEDEDVIHVNKNDININIASFLYDMITLSLPMISIPENCDSKDKYCDETTLSKLNAISTDDSNAHTDKDDVWADLKKIKDN